MLIVGQRKINPLRRAARLRKIVSVFAKHGFNNFLQQARLSRFITSTIFSYPLEEYTMAERMRLSFEQLGPVFIKFGQLLATRSDLIPEEFCMEFRKLQDSVPPLPFEKIEATLTENFQEPLENIFSNFDKTSIAAASIAQVYKAELISGEKVVVKIQRPGIKNIINQDIAVLKDLAHLLEKYIKESRVYSLKEIVQEFASAIELETHFFVEANNIRKMAKNFEKEPLIQIPFVYEEHSGERVLVMEAFEGEKLSNYKNLTKEVDIDSLVKLSLKAYLQMIFVHGFFHGDLHGGNMFALPKNRLGIIDFGIVGRLSPKERSAIKNMLIALATEDYEAWAHEYADISPYTENLNIGQFSSELRNLLSPYYGLNVQNINSGQLLMRSSALASKHKLKLPPNLIMFFRSVINIDSVLRDLKSDFDFLAYFTENKDFDDIKKNQYDYKRILKNIFYFSKDWGELSLALPRQIKQLLKRLGSKDFSLEVGISQLNDITRSIDDTKVYIFWGFMLSGLLISSTLLIINDIEPQVLGLPLVSLIHYIIISVVGLYLFLRKK